MASTLPTPKKPSARSGRQTTTSSEITKKPSKPTLKQASKQQKTATITKKIPSLPTPPSRQQTLHKKKQKKSLYRIWLLLIWLIWLWGYYLSTNLQPNGSHDLIINQSDDVLFVGKDITVQWTLSPLNIRRKIYTHTITDTHYGTLGVRSQKVNLFELTGSITLHGIIKDFINNTYIIEVDRVDTPTPTETQSSWALLVFSQPGLIIKNMAQDGFSISQQAGSPIGTITIINPTSKAQVVMRYFACNTQEAYNCKRFQESFESTVGVQFTDSYNNKFYKLKDSMTWFVNLDNLYGVYIETSNQDLLTMIIKNTQFITNTWATHNVSPIVKNICSQSWSVITQLTSSNLHHQWDDIIRTVQGIGSDYDTIQCSIHVNPITISQSSLVSLTRTTGTKNNTVVINPTSQTGKVEQPPVTQDKQQPTSTNSNQSSLWSVSVPQIPLKPGKEMTFSTKWLSLSLPSPNIAFASSTINTTINNLKCSTKTQIILYANKTNLQTNPSVVIYFCSTGTPTPATDTRVISTKNQTLQIQALDPAWTNFINNIKVN